MAEEALVSVVTPVYNGDGFLAECVESVLGQSYKNFEYVIVNNCSEDRTAEIASKYARQDERIRVHNNTQFVGVIQNHNIAFRLISKNSRYCKVVSADDWLFPECLARMVGLAEANPSVGICGSYQLSGCGSNWQNWGVKWAQLPYPSTVVPGREICRRHLLGTRYVFGTPTSNLYRSDLIKGQTDFFPNLSPHADASACYKYLQHTDFGFVHQVLSYEREHDERQTAVADSLNAYFAVRLSDLRSYGKWYLTEEEVDRRIKSLLKEYYEFLAISAFNFRGKEFWRYHKEKLKEVGYPINGFRMGRAIGWKAADLALNPKRTLESFVRRIRPREG